MKEKLFVIFITGLVYLVPAIVIHINSKDPMAVGVWMVCGFIPALIVFFYLADK